MEIVGDFQFPRDEVNPQLVHLIVSMRREDVEVEYRREMFVTIVICTCMMKHETVSRLEYREPLTKRSSSVGIY